METTNKNRNSKVLIVDDNLENLNVLATILESENYTVYIANNGDDALKSVSKQKPDIILLDILMPGMDGFEVCSKLKANEQTKEIPVLFLSALTDTPNMVKAFQIGGLDYIQKPYSPEIVIARVETHIELYKTKQNLERIVDERTAELKQTNSELVLAKNKAEESDRLKSAFLQNMSHEIRTPMNAIMGFADLMKDAFEDKPKMEQYCDIIMQRCDDLLCIINDILDISKIESGEITLNIEECNITDLFADLREIFEVYKKRIEKQHIALSIQVDYIEPVVIKIDKVKLKQIFINLINNALKFTKNGSITVGYKLDGFNDIVFFVSDTGVGIPPEKATIIFERFTQLTPPTNQTVKGTGLGLSIVKGLLKLFNGKIWLESEVGKGTTFYFSLPVSYQ